MALIARDGGLGHAELGLHADALAARLAAAGIGPGDRVLLGLPTTAEWVVAYLATARAGAVGVPLNPRLTASELAPIVGHADVAAAFCDDTMAAALADAGAAVGPVLRWLPNDLPVPGHPAVPVDARAVRTIAYTSGTTGRPKGALQSHRSVRLGGVNLATRRGWTADDVVCTALPLAHSYGTNVVNAALSAGATLVLVERFDAAAVGEAVRRHRATVFAGVPAMYALLLAEGGDLGSLRDCVSAGQGCPRAIAEEWEARTGSTLVEGWGMTELGGFGALPSLHEPAPRGTVGCGVPGVEIRTTAPDGELEVRGPVTLLGYHRDPGATAAVLSTDGWFRTGDVGEVAPDGTVRIVDRLKDVVITGGFNVYPAEIEQVVAAHPDVALVAVTGSPHEIKGETPHAHVVLKAGACLAADDLLAHCRRHLAGYKLPGRVSFVDELPRNSTGKVQRRLLTS